VATEANVSNIFKNLLYFMRFVKWDIVHENEPLFVKDNDLDMNDFLRNVCIVGIKCDMCANDTPMIPS